MRLPRRALAAGLGLAAALAVPRAPGEPGEPGEPGTTAGPAAPRPSAARAAPAPAGDLELLEDDSAEVRRAALERLLAAGPQVAAAALQGLEQTGPWARRARSELVRRRGTAAEVPAVLEALAGPAAGDPEVRLNLVAFLGRPELAAAAAGGRLATLAELAAGDPEAAVRSQALQAMGAIPSPETAPALGALFDRLPASEHPELAALLAGLPAARYPVIDRVRASLGGATGAPVRPVGPGALAELLPAYGRILADLPGGGESARDLLPLAQGRRHPSGAVQAAAFQALESLLGRLGGRADRGRIQRVLETLAGLGWEPEELEYRLAWFGLSLGTGARESLAAARRLAERADLMDGGPWRFHGRYLEAAAQLALGRPEEARTALAAAAAILDGLLARRDDLRPAPSNPSAALGELAVDRHRLRAQVEVLTAVSHLAEDRTGRDLRVLEPLRRAHELLLEGELRETRGGLSGSNWSLDVLLGRDIGPRRLLFQSVDAPLWPRDRGLAVERELCAALASVAPAEMLGFEPAPGLPPRLADPLSDPRRLELLLALQRARFERFQDEQVEKFGPFRMPAGVQQFLSDWAARIERDPELGYPELKQLRGPSLTALDLAEALRADGRPGECVALVRRLLADLEAPELAGYGTWLALSRARAEMSLGGAYMDENLPREAEAALESALARLEEREASLNQNLAEEEGQRERLLLELDIERTRRLRSDALTSLAVNANVRLQETDRALAYFEQAYGLNQSDFMRVLLACYRARSGRAEEARALLDEVELAPPLYYNVACTFALLGETEAALEFLARDIEENHPSEGGRERQRAWARGDPDLVSLRGDPRFERLVGERGDR